MTTLKDLIHHIGILHEQGKTKEAITLLRAVYDNDTNSAARKRISFILAQLYYDQKEYMLGMQFLEVDLAANMHREKYLVLAACLYNHSQCYDKAGPLIDDALRRYPANTMLLGQRGRLLRKQGKYHEAITVYEQGLALDPNLVPFWVNICDCYKALDDKQKAVVTARKAVAQCADSVETWQCLAYCLFRCDIMFEALDAINKTLSVKPDSAYALGLRACIRLSVGELDKSYADFTRSLALQEDEKLRGTFSYLLLMRGEFAKAWPLYERRWQTGQYRQALLDWRIPKWQGESLEGKRLILQVEQGIGDQIFFASMVDQLHKFGAREIGVSVDQRLESLIARSTKHVHVIPGAYGIEAHVAERDQYDFHFPLASIPGMLGVFTKTRSAPSMPYLQIATNRKQYFRDLLSERAGHDLLIGVSWRSFANVLNPKSRSIALENWRDIAAIDGISLVNLQYGDVEDEIANTHDVPLITID
ncbi:MAG: tetratricopeptide repeat protein, partial [Pseudomonadota bacterium]